MTSVPEGMDEPVLLMGCADFDVELQGTPDDPLLVARAPDGELCVLPHEVALEILYGESETP